MVLSRLWRTSQIPVKLCMELWQYRTNCERAYVQNFAYIPSATLRGWYGNFMVPNDAVCFSRPLLTVNFRFLRKDFTYWRSVRDESRDHGRTCFIIAYQCSAHREMQRSSLRNNFSKHTIFWTKIEMSRGCNT